MIHNPPTIPPHPQFGEPQRWWHYYRADGSVFCSVARWDPAGEPKVIRPFHINGKGPEWKRPEGLAPLFALDRIQHVGRVLVVAGEKTAVAAQKLFPGWAVTTSIGGESAFANTDWAPVRGKLVTIWPDADDPGRRYAVEVAKLCLQAGARSSHIVELPDTAPSGWDLADTPPAGWDLPMMLEEAVEYRTDTVITPAQAVPAVCFDAVEQPVSLPTNYPDELWSARPWLQQLHRYAAARELDPDMLLGAVLARVSAVMPKGTAMDTGIMSARASLNLMVAGIGPTGAGKTQAMTTSGNIVYPPSTLDGFIAGQIGSGEGIAEAFMGKVVNDPSLPKKQQRFVPKQVRHNAFMFLDEGETLHKLAKQRGNNTLQVLRTAAVGSPLGALNATDETKRHVENYHLGIFIGWQPCTVGPLLAEVNEGTPQRFLFCMAGPPLDESSGSCALPIIELQNRPGLVVGFSDAIRADIRAEHRRRRSLPPSLEPDWYSHAMLLRCKVAALLCLVDHSHSERFSEVVVGGDHWDLAGVVCEVSHGITKWLVSHAREQAAEVALDRITAQAAGAQASQVAAKQAPAIVDSMARSVALKVHAGGEISKGYLRRGIRADKRNLFQAACDVAEANGWIIIEGNNIAPGPIPPA